MPTLVPVIIGVDEHTPGEVMHDDLYGGLFGHSSSNDASLYQSTVKCALTMAYPKQIITVASYAHGSIIHEQLAAFPEEIKANILLEPLPFRTTGTITAAAYHALYHFEDPVLWIVPIHQTHYYVDILRHAITHSARASLDHRIILYGMRTFMPDRRYAYIYQGTPDSTYDYLRQIRMYIPHPSKQSIASFWQDPHCLANSGLMLVKATEWLNYVAHDITEAAYGAYIHKKRHYYGSLLNPILFNQLPKQSLSKFLGLLSQKKEHPLYSYPLPSDTSKQNGWYQLWHQSQITRTGCPLQRFLMHLAHAA